MKVPVEVRCIACPLAFCCANCRRAHERNVHLLRYECPICRYQKFLCNADNLNNEDLIKHLVNEHLPLHCNRCDKIFSTMTDFINLNHCNTGIMKEKTGSEENEVTTNLINEEKEIEDRFNSLYERLSADIEDSSSGDNFEAIVSINTTKKTATITPVLLKKTVEGANLGENEHSDKKGIRTPHPKSTKVSRLKRTDTPHINKFLVRQLAQDDSCEKDEIGDLSKVKLESTKEKGEISGVEVLEASDANKTPSRLMETESQPEEIHTPKTHTLKVEMCSALASAVTTSTPTHPASSQWNLFPEPGADSPLSEIEGTGDIASPGEGSLNGFSKGELDSNSKTLPKKLKSIIITGGRSRLEGQDSSEKQVTFADSTASDLSSVGKTKKVKFADDTKVEDAKPKRVFRRPKRILTPGPQPRMRRITNPHFQALLNRFENQQGALARTPDLKREDQESESTPAMTDIAAMPARAIDFKDESPNIEDKPSKSPGTPGNELFQSCIESPLEPICQANTAIETFTNNIAGSIQTCLSSALLASDDATEIQFKFVITKKRVSVRRIVDDGKVVDEKTSEFDRQNDKGGDNMWKTITRAVKSVFWNRCEDKENCSSTTPVPFSRAKGSLELYSSASKRKSSEVSDSEISPLNHKRYKYGRIRGRRPLPRMLREVSGLKMSHSADQQNLSNLVARAKQEETLNQSF